MKIAMVQMQSTNQLLINLNKMKRWVEKASDDGAELIVFPEMAYLTGSPKDWQPQLPKYEDLLQEFKDWAKAFKIGIVPGTVREPVKSNPSRFFNALVYIPKHGQVVAKYRKIFLYRAKMADRSYNEPEHCEPGATAAVHESQDLCLGFAICFDLRFPEMFRSLKKLGAEVVLLPSAFTVPTGQAHWVTLIRARAIENQIFIVAPGLVGTSGDGAKTYGHSLIVNPWGEVVSEMQDEEGMVIADIQKSQISEAGSRVNAWESRREDIFPIR
jgi:deaminated glutathione amidase